MLQQKPNKLQYSSYLVTAWLKISEASCKACLFILPRLSVVWYLGHSLYLPPFHDKLAINCKPTGESIQRAHMAGRTTSLSISQRPKSKSLKVTFYLEQEEELAFYASTRPINWAVLLHSPIYRTGGCIKSQFFFLFQIKCDFLHRTSVA